MRLAITAFIAGGAFLFFLPKMPSSWGVVCSCILLLCVSVFALRPQMKWHGKVLLCITFFTLGFAWSAQYSQIRLNNILAIELEGVDLNIEGRVAALPQSEPTGAKFAFELNQVALGNTLMTVFPKKVYLSWQPSWRGGDSIPQIIPGQRWSLKVRLKRPYGALNPYAFDFERWSFHQDFGASGSVRSGRLLSENAIGLADFELRMELARWKFRQKIHRLLPENARYSGVIIALVMGDQNAINQDDWRVFNATGIGHLISISGLHVTMLAGVGAFIAAICWRRKTLPLIFPVTQVAALSGFLTAFIYAWLAGFQIPAQRTMYMVGVVAFALWTGRNPRSFDIWWWALAVVLLIDPMAPYTPGFWLSFGAVAAILFAMGNSPGLLGIPTGKELELHWTIRLRRALYEACRVQAVVTIALLPFTLFWFYQASLVSPIANAFAIPLVSYVVTPLAISGALLPEWIGKHLLILAHLSMEYLAALLERMANWPWAVIWSHQPGWILLVFSGIGIVYSIRPGNLSKDWILRTITLLPLGMLFVPRVDLLGPSIKSGEFRATVLDIGQGTAVLIETANKRLLYDTGPIQGKKDDAGQRVILPYLQGRGIQHIDRLVISHSDSDHVGGAASLLKQLSFDSMMGSLPSDNTLLLNLHSRKIPSIPCRYGQQWMWDGVTFLIWHPAQGTLFQEQYSMKPNEMSCVLEVRNQNTSFWLTGDVEKQGEEQIVDRLDKVALNAIGDRELVLMAPHHGSKTSSSVNLLLKLQPEVGFAQNGYRNRYGHPHPKVIARYADLGIPFHQTPRTGAQVWTFRSDVKPSVVFLRRDHGRLWHRFGEESLK